MTWVMYVQEADRSLIFFLPWETYTNTNKHKNKGYNSYNFDLPCFLLGCIQRNSTLASKNK